MARASSFNHMPAHMDSFDVYSDDDASLHAAARTESDYPNRDGSTTTVPFPECEALNRGPRGSRKNSRATTVIVLPPGRKVGKKGGALASKCARVFLAFCVATGVMCMMRPYTYATWPKETSGLDAGEVLDSSTRSRLVAASVAEDLYSAGLRAAAATGAAEAARGAHTAAHATVHECSTRALVAATGESEGEVQEAEAKSPLKKFVHGAVDCAVETACSFLWCIVVGETCLWANGHATAVVRWFVQGSYQGLDAMGSLACGAAGCMGDWAVALFDCVGGLFCCDFERVSRDVAFFGQSLFDIVVGFFVGIYTFVVMLVFMVIDLIFGFCLLVAGAVGACGQCVGECLTCDFAAVEAATRGAAFRGAQNY